MLFSEVRPRARLTTNVSNIELPRGQPQEEASAGARTRRSAFATPESALAYLTAKRSESKSARASAEQRLTRHRVNSASTAPEAQALSPRGARVPASLTGNRRALPAPRHPARIRSA